MVVLVVTLLTARICHFHREQLIAICGRSAHCQKFHFSPRIAHLGDDLGNANKLVEKMNDKLAKKNEELTQKDKNFGEREQEIKNDAYGDILYNVWLKYLNLDYSFLGPAMTKWIEVFKGQFVEVAIREPFGSEAAEQEGIMNSKSANLVALVGALAAPGGEEPPTSQP
ncbi:hypothetical protein ACOSQ3_019121 [Xanthoceras sorbifolium]